MKLTNISTVKELMERHGIKFQKKFGQNFLVNSDVPYRIADECGAGENDCVLEIGPGIGTLTQELCMIAGKVVAVEIDNGLIPVLEETLAEFYEKDFVKTQSVCQLDPETANVIKKLKEMGVKVVVATNPIFPKVAIMHRVKWAGLNPDDFEHITHYGNSRFSKPNPNYYLDIAEKLGVKPENCLMVGNDVSDDMPATKAGMKVFLKTRCLINKLNEDITQYPNGDWDKFWDYFYTI